MAIAVIFGLLSSLFLAFTGDSSAYQVAQKQPMKLAAMEGLYKGQEGTGLVAFGVLNHKKKAGDNLEEYIFKIELPKMLSLLGYRDANAFVPGIEDLVYGNWHYGIKPVTERMERGTRAIISLTKYKDAKVKNDTVVMSWL